jgi:hypothetical protein
MSAGASTLVDCTFIRADVRVAKIPAVDIFTGAPELSPTQNNDCRDQNKTRNHPGNISLY